MSSFSDSLFKWNVFIKDYLSHFLLRVHYKTLENIRENIGFQQNSGLQAYAFVGYDFIGLIFINGISIHIDRFVQRCSTLLRWIAWHSLTMIYCSMAQNLEKGARSAEQKCRTAALQNTFPEILVLLKTSRWLLLDTVWEGLRFNCLSYLIL